MTANIIPLHPKQSRVRVVQPTAAKVINIGRAGSCEQLPEQPVLVIPPVGAPAQQSSLEKALGTLFGRISRESVKTRQCKALEKWLEDTIENVDASTAIDQLNFALVKAHEEQAKGK